MEFPDNNPTAGRSPRRELQGPRPTPLRINKDSHKIKKPPLAPPQPSQPHQPPPPPRQPVIIYTVSPKIIHTTPGDFMSLVQRLTGSNSSSSTSSSTISSSNYNSSTTLPSSSISDVVFNNSVIDPFNGDNTVSPAARYATVEKARSPMGKKIIPMQNPLISGGIIGSSGDVEGVHEMMMMDHHGVMERTSSVFQAGILSPGPASLSPIPSSFFSPPPSSSDPSMVSFFHDLSPMLHSNRINNFMDYGIDGGGSGFIMPSPSNFVSPHTPSIDLFNYFLD